MNRRGYTMVELILVIVLLGLVTAMTVPMLVAGVNSYVQERQTSDIERQAMLALERMTREIRLGSNIVVGGATVNFDRGGSSVEIGYDNATNSLYLNRGGGNQTLATRVTGANFSEDAHEDARYIELQFSVAGSAHAWRSTIYPRNDQ